MPMIDKLGWLHIADRKLLVARSRGRATWYIPGGKREAGESDEAALIREISEELSVDLVPTTIAPFDTFEGQADGKADGTLVRVACYRGEHRGTLTASAEIDEIGWMDGDTREPCSAVLRIVLDRLASDGLIDRGAPVPSRPAHGAMDALPVRLRPGDDLRHALEAVVRSHGARAAFVVGGIGSLGTTRLRYAGHDQPTMIEGDVEILTLSGSVGDTGSHLHISVADARGTVSGGHVASGCIVRTTAEVLVALLPGWHFDRRHDPATGYDELVVRPA